jgi:hypothetical protein
MSTPWPVPEDGYKPLRKIGEPLTDDEMRELGYEPRRKGWTPTPVWLAEIGKTP